MIDFRDGDCSCIICGNKNCKTEVLRINREGGGNIISFDICKECQKRMAVELTAHAKCNEC